jgi:CRISPR/Cas system-associated endonuclease/helicase Cas3
MFIECNGKQYSTFDLTEEEFTSCTQEAKEKWEKAEQKCLSNPTCVYNRNRDKKIIYGVSFVFFILIIIASIKLFKKD